MDESAAAPTPRLFGVLVTHRRPCELREHLARLRRQTRQLDLLVVVDNAPLEENRRAVEEHGTHAPVELIALADNLGPAGGIARGLGAVLENATDRDWVLLLDDDNPPRHDDVLQRVFDIASGFQTDASIGGVGLTGTRFDRRRARFVRLADEDLHGTLDVDWIGGNQFPMYRISAVRDVGVFRTELFWGLEELDFGLRMRAAGYRIVISGELAHWAREQHDRLGSGPIRPTVTMTRVGWRQYYITRNMIEILRHNGHPFAAARVAVTRGLGKAAVHSLRAPTEARRTLALASRAVVDGWRGELGRTVDPEAVTEG